MLLVLSIGCAVKASLELIEAEQKYILAQQYKEEAPFEWYMADQYIKKAREEYGTSQLQDAETLAKEAAMWAAKVEELGKNISTDEDVESSEPNSNKKSRGFFDMDPSESGVE